MKKVVVNLGNNNLPPGQHWNITSTNDVLLSLTGYGMTEAHVCEID